MAISTDRFRTGQSTFGRMAIKVRTLKGTTTCPPRLPRSSADSCAISFVTNTRFQQIYSAPGAPSRSLRGRCADAGVVGAAPLWAVTLPKVGGLTRCTHFGPSSTRKAAGRSRLGWDAWWGGTPARPADPPSRRMAHSERHVGGPLTRRNSSGGWRPSSVSRHRSRWESQKFVAMLVKRLKCPWNATTIVSVGPFRCLATIRSASPSRGESFS